MWSPELHKFNVWMRCGLDSDFKPLLNINKSCASFCNYLLLLKDIAYLSSKQAVFVCLFVFTLFPSFFSQSKQQCPYGSFCYQELSWGRSKQQRWVDQTQQRQQLKACTVPACFLVFETQPWWFGTLLRLIFQPSAGACVPEVDQIPREGEGQGPQICLLLFMLYKVTLH